MTDWGNRKRRRYYGRIGTLGIALLMLIGCSSAASKQPAQPQAAPSAQPQTNAPAAQPAPAPAPKSEEGAPKQFVFNYAVQSGSFVPLWVAVDNGLFEKYGYKATAQMTGGTNAAKAQVAGQAEFSHVGMVELVNTDLAGGDLVGLVTETYAPLFSVIVNKSITKIDDLKGKTIGVTTTGASTDMMARLVNEKYHLDMKIVPTGGMPNIVAALQKGVIDAGVISPPTSYKAIEQGFVELTNGRKEGFQLPNSVFTATRGFMTQYPQTTKNLVKAYLEGLEMTRSQPDKAIAAIKKYANATDDVAKKTYDELKPEWEALYPVMVPESAQTVLKFSTNPKATSADPKSFYDNSILDQLKQEKFVESLKK